MLTNLLSTAATGINASQHKPTIFSINQICELSQSQAIIYLDRRAAKYLAFARRVRNVNLSLASCASLYAILFKQWSRAIAGMTALEYHSASYNWRMYQRSRAYAVSAQSKRNARKAIARNARQLAKSRKATQRN